MPTPVVGLGALAVITPLLTSGVNTVSVDATALALVINADANTTQVEVLVNTVITVLTGPTDVGGLNQFSGLVPIPTGNSVVQLVGRNYDPTNPDDPNVNNPLLTPTVQFDALYVESQSALLIGPPSGITIYRGMNSCQVEWAIPSYPGFLGVRVQYSTDPAGITTPYAQFGNLATAVTRTANLTIGAAASSVATVSSDGAPGYDFSTITTTTAQTKITSFGSVSIPSSTVASDIFYVILTNLIQDPTTNVVYESQAAGPVKCGFVDLRKVNPTDFLALQKATDIASRMISTVNRSQPTLDLTARAETRDIVINPTSLEMANMSVREWFARCCRSISALAQIDDADGDGVSDPVASSPMKQQLSIAFGLNAADTQTYIDSRFDILGESAGVDRGGATPAIVTLTLFTYTKPTANIVVPLSMVVSTIPDATSTATASFTSTSSAVLDASNPDAYYDGVNGWWGITVSGQCTVAGSVGNVGARSIQQITSGGPSGVSVINLSAAQNGSDQQSNSDYAAVIRNAQVTGVDTGTKNGYYKIARETPGITSTIVVPAGNIDMLRDWDPIRQKHVYGCVDVYVQGSSASQQANTVPFLYPSTSTYGVFATYLPVTLVDSANARFQIGNFATINYPLYTVVELSAVSAGTTLYLGTLNAQVDNTTGIVTLNPTENVYQRNADGSTSSWQISGANATNKTFLSAATQSNVVYSLMAREQAGIQYAPPLQPLSSISSVVGPLTGTLPDTNVDLIRTSDFLLEGGSNNAGDQVVVSAAATTTATANLLLTGANVPIDTAMSITLDGTGKPGNIVSLRSSDLSTLYEFGVDYTIVPNGRYRSYALQVLPNATTGQPNITTGATVVAAYNKYILSEKLTAVTDTIALSGSLSTNLSTAGIVQNVWLPESYGNTTLSEDTGLIAAGVTWANRYIKVTYTNGATTTVLVQGVDYTLTVSSTTYTASLTRILGGGIPDGASVSVSYFTTEVFTVTTEYPAYVQQVVTAIDETKAAAASVLVKAMVGSPVDLTFTVVLGSDVAPATADPIIRNAATILLNGAKTSLSMSNVVKAVTSVTGVASMNLPLQKCAKSNGAYSIGEIIPTGANWISLNTAPAFKGVTVPASTYITATPILQNSTIPSGGPANAYVGLLYQGESYRRASSVQDFLNGTGPAFYFIGTNDYLAAGSPFDSTYAGRILLMVPSTVVTPALYSYRATYQVFDQAGAQDINVSSTEYIVPGTITIIYAGS